MLRRVQIINSSLIRLVLLVWLPPLLHRATHHLTVACRPDDGATVPCRLVTLTNDLGSDGSGSSEEEQEVQNDSSEQPPASRESAGKNCERSSRDDSKIKFTPTRVKVVDANALLPRMNQLERVVSHSNIKDVKLNGYIVEGGSEGEEESEETDDDEEDEDENNHPHCIKEEEEEESADEFVDVLPPSQPAFLVENSSSPSERRIPYIVSTAHSSNVNSNQQKPFSFISLTRKNDREESASEEESAGSEELVAGKKAADGGKDDEDDEEQEGEEEEEEGNDDEEDQRPFVSPTMVVQQQIMLIQPKKQEVQSNSNESDCEEDEESEEDEEESDEEQEEKQDKLPCVEKQSLNSSSTPQLANNSKKETTELKTSGDNRAIPSSSTPRTSNDIEGKPGPSSPACSPPVDTSPRKCPPLVRNELSKEEEQKIRESLEKKRNAPNVQGSAQNPNVIIRYVVIKNDDDDDDDDDDDGEYTYEEVDDDDEDDGTNVEQQQQQLKTSQQQSSPVRNTKLDELRMNQLNTLKSRNN